MRSKALTKEGLWILAIGGLFAAALRLLLGLGATTGLNDTTPWGLWIAFKLCFVALAGGGFTLAAMVYIFHLETYRPLLRRAILIGLLGYGSFIVSLLFDLGLPWHIYMPIIHWQHHSVMFEIAWCVMLYFTVLILEFSPVILEHPWFRHPIFQKIAHGLHKATIPLVIAGIVLSTLHQSSLGSLFLIMPHRVHPLWYSAWIPVMFFISAIAMGMMALVVEGFLAERWFGAKPDKALLGRLGKIGGIVLWLYLGLRLGDLTLRGVLPGALDGSWQSLLFGLEITIGGILPAALLMFPSIRRRPEGLITSAGLAIAGIASQRMSLSLFAMWRPENAGYFPSLMEILIALGIPAAAALIYFLFVENLAVERDEVPETAADPYQKPSFDPHTGWLQGESLFGVTVRRLGMAVVVVALVFAALPSAGAEGQTMPPVPVQPARGWSVLIVDGNRDGLSVAFPHVEHQERMAEAAGNAEDGCLTCHHINKLEDEATKCSECHSDFYATASIFDHTFHQAEHGGNAGCVECHAGEHRADTAKQCMDCHEDYPLTVDGHPFRDQAPGYHDVMHTKCVDCHQQEAVAQDRPELDDCANCHPARQMENEVVRSQMKGIWRLP